MHDKIDSKPHVYAALHETNCIDLLFCKMSYHTEGLVTPGAL